jgi:putative ABC transport system permease protein
MSLIFTIASRNLFHDRLRFIATIIGIAFSIILVTVQLGLYFGFGRMVTSMIDHAHADLWIMSPTTKCFEDPIVIDDTQRFRAMSIPGVASVKPVVIGFAQWRLPDGGSSPVLIVGSELRAGGLRPWNVVAGGVKGLEIPGTVAVDQSYLGRLGITGIGSRAEISDQKVEVAVLTRGIRSFTTMPYVFVPLDRARAYAHMSTSKTTYFLVHLEPHAELESVRAQLKAHLRDLDVLTPAEFRDRSLAFWLFGTGAGAALFAGALLGVIVGTVIVAQTLYSSTKDHINEFATLRAIGSSKRYIHKVIISQALLNAVIGFGAAAAVTVLIVRGTANSALPIMVTPQLAAGLFVLTVVMCVISSTAAIVKVTRIDPAMVFTR